MTTSQKAALSLLVSVVLFGIFTALSFTGIFNLIETRFYNPSITASITREISRNAEEINSFFTELQTRFSETLKEPPIRRSFLPNQSAEDIYERSRIYGILIESLGGLQWVRFIDSGGSRLHYSSHEPDILYQDRMSLSYHNYSEPDFPYAKISVGDNEALKYTFDERVDRILFSFPFYDSFDVYRGTALFSVSIKAISDHLLSNGRIKAGQEFYVISDPPGMISGMSSVSENSLTAQVSAIWKRGGQNLARIDSPGSGISLNLISTKTSQGFMVGRLVNEDMFSFPDIMKIILLVTFFLTVYLTIFLFFNLRQDSVTIIQNRLKQLQISLIEQYYDRKGDMDWSRWSRELDLRRDEINTQLKRGLRNASGSKGKDIDLLIDKSWDELLSVMGGRRDESIDEAKLQVILSRILAALPGSVPNISPQLEVKPVTNRAPVTVKSPNVQPAAIRPPAPEADPSGTDNQEAAELEELEVLEEIEPAEEAEVPQEPAQEVNAAEKAEAVDPVETLDVVEAADVVEVLDEAEVIDEVEVVDEVEALEEIVPAEGAEMSEKPAQNLEESIVIEEPEVLEELEEAEDGEVLGEAVEEIAEKVSVEAPVEIAEEIVEVAAEAAAEVAAEADVEVPVIDVTEMNLSPAIADEAMLIDSEEDIEELESIDAVNESEEEAELQELTDPDAMPADQEGEDQASGIEKHFSEEELANLASVIEFSQNPESESSGDEIIHEDLEVVSPFSTMLSNLNVSHTDEDTGNEEEVTEIEEEDLETLEEIPELSAEEEEGSDQALSDSRDKSTDSQDPESLLPINNDEGEKKNRLTNKPRDLPENMYIKEGLVYKPFGFSGETDIETLEALPDKDEELPIITDESDNPEKADIIEEREGVHYISGNALNPGTETTASLNRDFKNLVDSVIK